MLKFTRSLEDFYNSVESKEFDNSANVPNQIILISIPGTNWQQMKKAPLTGPDNAELMFNQWNLKYKKCHRYQ